jgi:hypothetical protein
MEACAALLEPREQALGWLVAPTRDLVDRIFLRVVDTLRSRLPHRVLDLDLRAQRIVVANLAGGKSEVRGKSADMPVTLLGEALDFLIIDEAAKLRGEVWESYLSPRLVDRWGWVLFVSTPAGANWFYQLYRQAARGKDPESQAWASPSWDNPYLEKDVIDAERAALPADTFAEQYGAVFLGAEQEPCDLCGGPSPTAPGIVLLLEGEELPRCPTCGKVVDEHGKTLVRRNPDGSASPRLIILYGLEEEEAQRVVAMRST